MWHQLVEPAGVAQQQNALTSLQVQLPDDVARDLVPTEPGLPVPTFPDLDQGFERIACRQPRSDASVSVVFQNGLVQPEMLDDRGIAPKLRELVRRLVDAAEAT